MKQEKVYIKCINAQSLPLTNGRIYHAYKDYDSHHQMLWYKMKNNEGNICHYVNSRFIEVDVLMPSDKVEILIGKCQTHLANIYAEAEAIEETMEEAETMGEAVSEVMDDLRGIITFLKNIGKEDTSQTPQGNTLLESDFEQPEQSMQSTDSMAQLMV